MENSAENGKCPVCNSGSICFSKLIPNELEYLNNHKSMVIYRRGETVCKEGGLSSGVKYIRNGLVKVFLEGPNNRNIIVKIVNAGDFLGLSTLFGSTTFSYSASALTDTTICMISREAILELILKNGDFALEITKWYCLSYEKAYKKLESIGFKNLPGRMAYVLIYLDQEKFKNYNIYSHLSRKDLAEIAGVPMESAVRILSEFDKSNIIRLSGKNIAITDPKLLSKICSSG